MVIRAAGIADLVQVYDLLNALRLESIWATIPIEPSQPYVHVQLLNILHDASRRMVVADRNGEIVGVCHGAIAEHEYLPGLTYVIERDFYVLPRYRHLGIGKQLWNDVLQWGKAHGAYGGFYGRIKVQSIHRCVEEIIWTVFDHQPAEVICQE